MRTHWVNIAALLVGALLLVAFMTRPYISVPNAGPAAIHDLASLPDEIGVCGRDWAKDGLNRQFSVGQLTHMTGLSPVVVDPGLFTGCPPGTCTSAASDAPCHTVIYVRVAEDAYVGFSLQGGP